MAQAIGDLVLSSDWATIAATPRKFATAFRLGAGSPGRLWAERANASAAAAMGPGLFRSKRLDQAAKRPAASREAPRHAARSDTGTSFNFSTALSMAPAARRQSSGIPTMVSLPGATALVALHSLTADVRSATETSQNWRRFGKVKSLASLPPPNQIGAAPSLVLTATE
jgi:hypothetical protein